MRHEKINKANCWEGLGVLVLRCERVQGTPFFPLRLLEAGVHHLKYTGYPKPSLLPICLLHHFHPSCPRRNPLAASRGHLTQDGTAAAVASTAPRAREGERVIDRSQQQRQRQRPQGYMLCTNSTTAFPPSPGVKEES